MNVKNAINEGLKKRMDAKFDANGNIKRPAWYLNKELVLSTIIDPRFKIADYFDVNMHEEYTKWLFDEAEFLFGIIHLEEMNSLPESPERQDEEGIHSLFAEFVKNKALSAETIYSASESAPLPSPSSLNARQKSEVN